MATLCNKGITKSSVFHVHLINRYMFRERAKQNHFKFIFIQIYLWIAIHNTFSSIFTNPQWASQNKTYRY